MSAVLKQPLDYVRQDLPKSHIPRNVTVKSHDYHDFMAEKVAAKEARIEHLELIVGYQKSDLTSCGIAIVGLLITLGIVLYQWLVVCNGQAPL